MKQIASYSDELESEGFQDNRKLRAQLKKKRKEFIRLQRVNKYSLEYS